MTKPYTERANELVIVAQRQAAQLGSEFTEPEHLVLAFLQDRYLTDDLLRGVDVEDLREEIVASLTRRNNVPRQLEAPLGRNIDRALLYATEEAEHLGDAQVRTPLLLLGLMRVEDSFAVRLLTKKGLSFEALRTRLLSTSQKGVIGGGKRWNEVNDKAKSLEEHGFTIAFIKDWREKAAESGRPSGLKDFFRAHGVCPDCRGVGLRVTGWDQETENQLWDTCSTCKGKGRVPVQ